MKSSISWSASLLTSRTLATASCALALIVTGCSQEKTVAAQPQQNQQSERPVPVDIITVALTQIPRTTSLTGRTHAFAEAEIRPQVSGIIEARLFEEGQTVKKGDPLYKIEDSEYRAALQSAKANLASAQASARSAVETEQRFKRLADMKAVSQEDYSTAKAAAEMAEAQIDVAKAAVASAEIDLRRTRIVAPISGRIGRSSITEGALVTASQTSSLARISQLDPIYLDMTASSNEVLDWKRQVARGEILTTGNTNTVEVSVLYQDGETYPYKGQLEFTEVNVDETAGTVIVRAKLPNPDDLLLPGMFLKAEFSAGVIDQAAFIPQKAVQRDARTNPFVYVVNEQGRATIRNITAEDTRDSNWIVTDGLENGDHVIVSGFQKVKDGTLVLERTGAMALTNTPTPSAN